MKQIYQALDGTIFDTISQCEKYERELGKNYLQLYDGGGNLVDLIDESYFIHIDVNGVSTYLDDSPYSLGAAAFIDMCSNQNAAGKGIDLDSYGWFYWDAIKLVYTPISNMLINAFRALPPSAFEDVEVEVDNNNQLNF